MTNAIDHTLLAEPNLKNSVLEADAALRAEFTRPAEGRTWSWQSANGAGNGSGATLTMDYEGNSLSHYFAADELRKPTNVLWQAHLLWQNLLLANIRRSAKNIANVLAEIEQERELQEV